MYSSRLFFIILVIFFSIVLSANVFSYTVNSSSIVTAIPYCSMCPSESDADGGTNGLVIASSSVSNYCTGTYCCPDCEPASASANSIVSIPLGKISCSASVQNSSSSQYHINSNAGTSPNYFEDSLTITIPQNFGSFEIGFRLNVNGNASNSVKYNAGLDVYPNPSDAVTDFISFSTGTISFNGPINEVFLNSIEVPSSVSQSGEYRLELPFFSSLNTEATGSGNNVDISSVLTIIVPEGLTIEPTDPNIFGSKLGSGQFLNIEEEPQQTAVPAIGFHGLICTAILLLSGGTCRVMKRKI